MKTQPNSQAKVLSRVAYLQFKLCYLTCFLFIPHLRAGVELSCSPSLLRFIKKVLLNLDGRLGTRYPRLNSIGGAENANYLSCMSEFLTEEVVGWSSSSTYNLTYRLKGEREELRHFIPIIVSAFII